MAKNRAQRLLLPAVYMAVICALVYIVWKRAELTNEDLVLRVAGTLTAHLTKNFLTQPMWFLYCLFVVEALAVLVSRVAREYWIPACMVLGVVGVALSPYTAAFVPFRADAALACLLFFGFGGWLKTIGFNPSSRWAQLGWWGFALLGAWLGLTLLSPVRLNIALDVFGPTPLWALLSCVTAVLGSWLMLIGANLAAKIRPLEWLGRNTMAVIGFNQLMIIVAWYMLDLGRFHWLIPGAATAALTIGASWLIARIPVFNRFINGLTTG